ncbi:unnamed protein product [Rotaria magnacalcarata]|uniref:Uncharacterized protein n=1 Tax=Rotaria magnacalcarata TaxID=392030 RepID=A0A8S2MS95_9BILA|nr:unnamed protein product [Rotaria magnacalcarata]
MALQACVEISSVLNKSRDINRNNFYNILPEIFNDINKADYVAIDGEFTGVIARRHMNYFDTPAERYKRHYDYDRHYLMIQIRLVMIRCTSPTENRYALKDGIPYIRKTTYLQKSNDFQLSSSCVSNSRQRSKKKKSVTTVDVGKQFEFNNLPIGDDLNISMAGFSAVMRKLQESVSDLIDISMVAK